MRAYPFEVMLRRKNDLMVAAVVDVLERAAIDKEFERFGVVVALANLEHHVQMRSGEMKALETCVFVVFV